MAVTKEAKRVSVSLKLDNGVSDTGAQKTVSLSLGTLNKNSFDAQKAMNIINLLTPCLEKTLITTESTEVDTLTETL